MSTTAMILGGGQLRRVELSFYFFCICICSMGVIE